MNIDAIPMGAEILAFKEIKADSNNNLSDFKFIPMFAPNSITEFIFETDFNELLKKFRFLILKF